MKIITVLLLFSIPLQTRASIATLVREYLDENATIKEADRNFQNAKFDQLNSELAYRWNFDADYTHNDDQRDNASNINNQGKTTTAGLSFSKPFVWGGAFSFGNELTKTDAFFSLAANKTALWSFSQTLGYSQDLGKNLFGQNSRLELSLADRGKKLADINYYVAQNRGVADFIMAYIDASLAKSKHRYQKEAVKRARDRLKLITRRVRDGLSLKVDKLEAQNAMMAQTEAQTNTYLEFRERMRVLSSFVHRSIQEKEVKNIKTLKFREFNFKSATVDQNPQMKSLAEQVKIAEESLKIAQNNIAPELSLSFEYQTNDFDTTSSETFSNGNLSGDKNQKSIALNVSIPFDWDLERNEKAKESASLELAKYQERSLKNNLVIELNTHIYRRRTLGAMLNSITQRKSISTQTLKEYSRLYRRGKVRLDQVIRAEESYIQIQGQLAEVLASRHKLELGLAQFFGKSKWYVMNNL